MPELDKTFDYLKQRIRDESIRVFVMRVKRGRNPDMVFLERLEHFLRDVGKENVMVVLAGVRPDFIEVIKRLNLYALVPSERIFAEETQTYSATLQAVRYAHELLGDPNSLSSKP
jgi:sulfate permease, SulP family